MKTINEWIDKFFNKYSENFPATQEVDEVENFLRQFARSIITEIIPSKKDADIWGTKAPSDYWESRLSDYAFGFDDCVGVMRKNAKNLGINL